MCYGISEKRINEVIGKVKATLDEKLNGTELSKRRFDNGRKRVFDLNSALIQMHCSAAYKEEGEEYLREPDYMESLRAMADYNVIYANEIGNQELLKTAKEQKTSVENALQCATKISTGRAFKYTALWGRKK